MKCPYALEFVTTACKEHALLRCSDLPTKAVTQCVNVNMHVTKDVKRCN